MSDLDNEIIELRLALRDLRAENEQLRRLVRYYYERSVGTRNDNLEEEMRSWPK